MKDFYGYVMPIPSMNHLSHHLVSENLKPIGLDPSWDASGVLHIVNGRLQLAKPEDRKAALYLSVFDCHGDEMTPDEWCMFFCGYVVGEGLGLATCFALINDKTARTQVSILVCRVDENGKRTPFHSCDQLQSSAAAAATDASGEV